jgi:hypothetical protein
MLFVSTGDTSEAGIAYPTLPPQHMGSPHLPVVCGVVRVAQPLASCIRQMSHYYPMKFVLI